MPVHLTKEFLDDLKGSQDLRFVREVLSRTVGQDGSFTADRDDHRYDGIKDGWIRYVSRGRTAYRVIFIRKGADVFLYRAGPHAIEDNLHPPKTLQGAITVSQSPGGEENARNDMRAGCGLLKTTEATFISRHMQSMFHVRHKEIFLVSPYVEFELLQSSHSFGRFLDRAVEEDTSVVLVTSASQAEERLPAFKLLEERGISVYFLTGLHTKLYMFDVDLGSRNAWQQGIESHAIIGSSNLTDAGLGFTERNRNEELNCRLPSDLLEEVKTYVTKLMVSADDYTKYAFRTRGKRPR